jgi:hypothetical protein
MNKLLLFFCFTFSVSSLIAQNWPAPELPDTSSYGKYTSRTMHLLHTSTPQKRNTVKILVYGQSISAQDWWFAVKDHIQTEFPNANLIMENKAIGGFASQILCKTVEMDVSTFYPDSVLQTIRSRTSAEIAIQTDHYTGPDAWSDTMSYRMLPAMAKKYKCDLINLRDPWKKYLADHKLEAKDLLKDNVHLNKYGEFLMAELIKPLFCFKAKFESDPFHLCSTYQVGKDVKINKGKLQLPFVGNRVDVVYETQQIKKEVKASVLVDQQKPSDYQGTYFVTRPIDHNNKYWPWTMPAMIQITHQTPWIAEDWTCKFTEANAPYEDFSFEISGSRTGFDGSGTGNADFISNSKRIIIEKGDADQGGDWHLNRSFKVTKTEVKSGDEVSWKTYTISTDTLKLKKNNVPVAEEKITIFQGIPNKKHLLTIENLEEGKLPVKEVHVYKPFITEN